MMIYITLYEDAEVKSNAYTEDGKRLCLITKVAGDVDKMENNKADSCVANSPHEERR